MRPEVAKEIAETWGSIGEPPCEKFSCACRPLCKEKELACSAFVSYLDGRSEPKPAMERPTRILFLQHMRHGSTTYNSREAGPGRPAKQRNATAA